MILDDAQSLTSNLKTTLRNWSLSIIPTERVFSTGKVTSGMNWINQGSLQQLYKSWWQLNLLCEAFLIAVTVCMQHIYAFLNES